VMEYALRIRSTKSYAEVTLPVATGQDDLREVYPVTVEGQAVTIGGGEWFYFDLPEAASRLRLQPDGRDISEFQVRNSAGEVVLREVWVATNGQPPREVAADGSRRGWSMRFRADGGKDRAAIRSTGVKPVEANRPLYLSINPEKFFWPTTDEVPW